MIHCDIDKCVGCRSCEVTCSSFHFHAVAPALSRIRVAKLEEIGIDLAVACLSCLEKYCRRECPNEALAIGPRGEILTDIALCDSCESCVEACPIGAVGIYNDHPLFCDLCGGEPSCVDSCPTGALSHIDSKDVSLKSFENSRGRVGQRRAHYAEAVAKPLRSEWARGRRVDP